MKHVPNILTTIRILLVPLFPYLFFLDHPSGKMYALLIFLIAGFTDVADGYIARKFNIISKFGIALDPLADKMMLITTIITLYIAEMIPLVIVIFFILKELIMITTGMLLYFKDNKSVIPSNVYGKLGTALFSLAVIVSLLVNSHTPSIIIFLLAFAFKVMAFVTYVISYRKSRKSA